MIEAVRTPYGARGGALSAWHPVDLLAQALNGAVGRAGLGPGQVGDVIVGCASQVGAQAGNVARRALLAAGWPEHVPGTTVDRQAASGAQAVVLAAQAVSSGAQEVVVAGGIDVMSLVPLGATLAVLAVGKPMGRGLASRYRGGDGFVTPGQAAEEVASTGGLAREDLDRWAALSLARAKKAKSLPYLLSVPAEPGGKRLLRSDEGPPKGLGPAELAYLEPLFEPGGVVTAANLAREADGAAAVVVASPAGAERLGLVPKARIELTAVVGVPPASWPLATVQATQSLLGRCDLGVGHVDRYEVHESSAAAVLAWLASTGASEGTVNPEGGSLATGSPLGAAGAGLFAGPVHALAGGHARRALVTVAGDGGVGLACLLTPAT